MDGVYFFEVLPLPKSQKTESIMPEDKLVNETIRGGQPAVILAAKSATGGWACAILQAHSIPDKRHVRYNSRMKAFMDIGLLFRKIGY